MQELLQVTQRLRNGVMRRRYESISRQIFKDLSALGKQTDLLPLLTVVLNVERDSRLIKHHADDAVHLFFVNTVKPKLLLHAGVEGRAL